MFRAGCKRELFYLLSYFFQRCSLWIDDEVKTLTFNMALTLFTLCNLLCTQILTEIDLILSSMRSGSSSVLR